MSRLEIKARDSGGRAAAAGRARVAAEQWKKGLRVVEKKKKGGKRKKNARLIGGNAGARLNPVARGNFFPLSFFFFIKSLRKLGRTQRPLPPHPLSAGELRFAKCKCTRFDWRPELRRYVRTLRTNNKIARRKTSGRIDVIMRGPNAFSSKETEFLVLTTEFRSRGSEILFLSIKMRLVRSLSQLETEFLEDLLVPFRKEQNFCFSLTKFGFKNQTLCFHRAKRVWLTRYMISTNFSLHAGQFRSMKLSEF